MTFNQIDLEDLQNAKDLLETTSIAAKITNFIGYPIEKGFEILPQNWNEKIGDITQAALLSAHRAALLSLKDVPGKNATKSGIRLWKTKIIINYN